MILGGLILLILLAVLVTYAGRYEKGLWRYRGIRWLEKQGRKRGHEIPGWIEERMLLRTWLMLFAGSAVLTLWGVTEFFTDEAEISKLRRPEYGQGSVQEELALEWEEEEGRRVKEKMTVEVEEKSLTKEEEEAIFYQVKEKLGKVILNGNASADYVNQPLYLPEKLEGFPVTVSWNSSEPMIVDWEGRLGAEIPEEGKLVCLTASIYLNKKEDTYFRYVRVFPPEKSSREELQDLLREENKSTADTWMDLPNQLRGQKLYWKKSRDENVKGIGVLVFLCPFLLLMRDKQKVQEKKKLERQQMMRDYPEILSKLTLLLSAGINLRKAMERIGKDYVNYRRDGEKHKAYEVILEVCREMDRGISEKEAYERLGEQCGLLSYRTLSAMLIQHLQKGSRGMERMLEEEAQKAQEMRQQQARVLGEQASTKLLIPMILMLLVVFVILIVPAWLTFAL